MKTNNWINSKKYFKSKKHAEKRYLNSLSFLHIGKKELQKRYLEIYGVEIDIETAWFLEFESRKRRVLRYGNKW